MAKGQMETISKMHWKRHFDLTFVTFIIHTLSSCCSCTQNNGEVFIQTDNELRFMIDGIPLPISAAESLMFTDESGNYDKQDHRLSIQFDPPTLDFDTQPVGMPSLRRITVINIHHKNHIHLLSISGSTPHFHCSFFKDKILHAGKNTTFDVVFLARQVGNVEHALKIQTDKGVFMYQVFGVGVDNAFRLKPLLGAKVPVNGSYSPVITMHNPFSKALHVVEMFSSGGNIHLELPTGAAEATRNMWEILPFETKPVMRATYLANKPANDTGYIRIRTKSKQGKDELLIVPLEVEVSEKPGLYSPQHVLDFGVIHSDSTAKSLPLFVINSSIKPIEITDILLEPPNKAIGIEFVRSPTVVYGNVEQMSMVAMLYYDIASVTKSGKQSGSVVITAKSGERLSIPYTAELELGSLRLDIPSSLTIHTSEIEQATDLIRPLSVKNTFQRPLVVHNITISANSSWLRKKVIRKHVVIPAGGVINLAKLTVNSAMKRVQGALSTYIDIHTNVSVFTIPVHVYDGKLEMVFQHNSKELDFGSLGFSESRELYFTLRNNNPINITIQDLYSTSKVTKVELFGVEKGAGTTLTKPPDWSNIVKDPLKLPPNHFAVYKVKLTAPKSDGNYLVDIRVATNYDMFGKKVVNTFYIPVRFRTTEGSVKSIPEKIVFDKAFPTKVPFKVLKIRSSFASYTEVTKVSFLPEDSRFRYEPTKNTPTVLEPFQDTVIGHIYFDAQNSSINESYAGLPLNSPGGLNWIAALSLLPGSDVVDTYLYNMYRSRWQSLQHRSIVNATVQVDTEWIQNFLFPAQAHLVWPSLLQDNHRLRFQPTHIGNLTSLNVVVENPSHTDVTIQILPLSLYTKPQAMVDLFMNTAGMKRLRSYIDLKEKDIFTLQNLEKYNTKSGNPVPAYREDVREDFGVMPHMDSIATTLLPGVRVSVSIGFQPKLAKNYVSLILIRNNLTILDALVVSGKGATSNIHVLEQTHTQLEDETIARNLNFDMTVDTSTEGCLRSSKGKQGTAELPINSSHKVIGDIYKFTLYNNGTLPVYVHGFDLDGTPCSYKGFQLLNCSGFQLGANKTQVMELVYYPDFSSAQVQTILTIHASGNLTHNITVTIDTPPRVLIACRNSLPRPVWEENVYVIALIIMPLLLIISLLLAYVDMRKVFSTSLRSRARAEMSVFDLRKTVEASAATQSSGGSQSCQEVRRRTKGPEATLNNGITVRAQASSDILKTQTEKRHSQNGTKSLQQLPLSQGDGNGIKLADLSKRQSGSRSVKGSPTSSSSSSVKATARLNNTTVAAKPNRNVTPVSSPVEKVNNNLFNGGSPQLRQGKQVNNCNDSTAIRPEMEDTQSESNKHDHRKNLLTLDTSTAATSTATTTSNVSTSTVLEPTNQGEGDTRPPASTDKSVGVADLGDQESDPSMMVLSEEVRAKLQQNSRAQLKKQQKKSSQAKLKVKRVGAGPAMVTKGVGTTDLEDSTSLSTDSGSVHTSDGKSKHVADWLTKLPDKGSSSWALPSPTHHINGMNSDLCSVASETPSWDTVAPDNYNEDFSDMADQTKSFAETMNPDRTMTSISTPKVCEPIGTRPQRKRFSATPSWDFPAAHTVMVPSPTESPLITPRAPIGGLPLPTDSLSQSSGGPTTGQLLKRLQAERNLELANHTARKETLAHSKPQNPLDDWSELLRLPSESESVWNPAQSWASSISSVAPAVTTSSGVWDTPWSPWSENQPTNGIASSFPSTNGVFSSTGSLPTSTSRQLNSGTMYPFIPDLWSQPETSTASATIGSQVWNFEQPKGATDKDKKEE